MKEEKFETRTNTVHGHRNGERYDPCGCCWGDYFYGDDAMWEEIESAGVVSVFIGIVFAISLLYRCFTFWDWFVSELRYLNMEIERAKGVERSYWLRRKRKLWRSLIPFVEYRY